MSQINLTIADSTYHTEFKSFKPPLQSTYLEGGDDVLTLDNNVSTYYTYGKREWTIEWSYMPEATYNDLRGFYIRQLQTGEYPNITINKLVSGVDARMYMGNKQILNHCGDIIDISITFRES